MLEDKERMNAGVIKSL